MTAPDFNSPTWAFLKEHYETRISSLRKQNDSLALNEVTTAAVRGRIAELQSLIDMQEQSRRDKSLQEHARR